jgi:predicted TIM-barrel fold metal-dependent hydrolase
MSTLIIDSHCHFGKGDGLTGPWDTNAPLRDYLQWCSDAGIHKTVLFAALHANYARANFEVAKIVQREPDRFFGYAFLDAERDKGRINQMVRTAVEEYGFCGIKVHRSDAPITREICRAARRYRLPVLYDVMGEIATVQLLATEYPDVDFIIPHLGTFSDRWDQQLSFIDHLVRHPNIYTDSSGVKRHDLLKMAYERAGAHKIIFGSDGPWLHPGVELAKILYLNVPAEEEALMLSGNFLRLTRQARRTINRISPPGRASLTTDR